MQNVSLEDKYELNKGRIFVNGTQVLVKLPFIQKKIDKLKNNSQSEDQIIDCEPNSLWPITALKMSK